MNSTPKKRGRPQAHYRAGNGDIIVGLSQRADGRWRIIATGQTFSEPDERLAIMRFRRMTTAQDRVILPIAEPGNMGHAEAPVLPIIGAPSTAKRQVLIEAGGLNDAIAIAEDLRGKGFKASAARVSDRGTVEGLGVDIHEDRLWAWFREQIITRPKYVAERTGVEQIGYLSRLSRPTPPTMAELIDHYAAKPGLTTDEASRCRRFWREFVGSVGIGTLDDLAHEHIERYEAKLVASDLAPKSIKHRHTRIRTIIAYAMKRGRGVEDCRRALDLLAMLQVEGVNTLDPDPIAPADFWAIHAEAEKAGDKQYAALMLFALNAALYSSEVGAVRWVDLDLKRGEFSTRRNKTKVPRVAVLWPETIKAMKALPHDRDTVFQTTLGRQFTKQTVGKRWAQYRTDAKLMDVVFPQIRDAAFTTACRVDLDQARVLAGHRLPGAVDHYVLRRPQAVADACAAIRAEFYGEK